MRGSIEFSIHFSHHFHFDRVDQQKMSCNNKDGLIAWLRERDNEIDPHTREAWVAEYDCEGSEIILRNQLKAKRLLEATDAPANDLALLVKDEISCAMGLISIGLHPLDRYVNDSE